MFSANKITGMTVVLSETLKEIISDGDKFQQEHPYSCFNKDKTNAGQWKYVAVKPWENVQKGSIPKQTSRRPNAGYTGHVPALRETHSSTFGTSFKMAQRANHSNTIKEGEHYTDGGHWKSSAELGSLSGNMPVEMPASAAVSQQPTPAQSQYPTPLSTGRSRRSNNSRRSNGSNGSVFPRGGDTLNLVGSDGFLSGDGSASGRGPPKSGRRSHRSMASSGVSSNQSVYSTMSQEAQAHRVKQLFKELPSDRQRSLMSEMKGNMD